MSCISLVLLGLALALIVAAIDWLTKPPSYRRMLEHDPPNDRAYVARVHGGDKHHGTLRDQVRDRRPPRNHARVRR